MKEINKHALLEIKHMWGHVNTEHTQYPNNMSIHKIHEDPKHATNHQAPPIYLPLWQQSTKKERKGSPGLEKAGSSCSVRRGELRGGVVVCRSRLLFDLSRRSSRSRRNGRSSWLQHDDRGVHRRSSRDESRVRQGGANSRQTNQLRLCRRLESK